MPDSTVRLNILSSFQTEGGEETAQATRGVREELEGIAEAADEAGESLTSRFTAAIEDTAQATERAANRMLEFRGYEGDLYADIAREATQAGDRQVAAQALYRAAQEDEPQSIIDRANLELAQARREAGEGAPAAEMEGGGFGQPDRLARNLQARVEDAIPTIVANTASGRLGVAERSLTNAEEYLDQLRELGHNTEAIEDLTDTLTKHRDTLEEAKAERDAARADPSQGGGGGGGPDGRGLAQEIGDMATQRGLAGLGPAGGVIGRLAGFLGSPAGLALLGTAATVGGGIAATRWLHGAGEEGRQEALGYVDLGRNLGTDDPLMYRFVGGGFRTRRDFEDIGYTSREAGQFAAAYAMPGRDPDALAGDVLSGMQLARYTGASTDAIAGLMQTGRQAGAFEEGGGEAFATSIFRAVRDGTQLGVSTATTFELMERHLSALVQQGITGSQEQLAMQAALLTNLSMTGSRALMGQAGAQALEGMVGGITETGDPGMEMIGLRALSGPDGMPSAEEMGLTGAMARQYEGLRGTSDVLAGRFLMERARGRDPEALSAVAGGFEEALGGRSDLEFMMATQMLGLSYEQTAELRDSYGSVFGALSEPVEHLRPEHLAQVYGENLIGGEALGMRDVQDDETNLTRAGLREQHLEFLEAESQRLQSLIAATIEFTDVLSQGRRNVTEFFARFREDRLEDAPPWFRERVEREDADWAAEDAERMEREEQERLDELQRDDARRRREGGRQVPPEALENDDVAVSYLYDAIATQETGGIGNPYHAVNPDVEGDEALGRYQILGSNIEGEGRGWDWEYLGRDLTRDEFLENTDAQDMIARARMLDYYQQTSDELPVEERLGRVASAWYAGPRMLNVPTDELPDTPEWAGGNEYPSIMEYVRDTIGEIRGDGADPDREDEVPDGLRDVEDAENGAAEREEDIPDGLRDEPEEGEPGAARDGMLNYVLGALQGGAEASTPPAQTDPSASGTLRLEGEGTLNIVVAPDVPEGQALQDLLQDAIGSWRERVGGSRYNQQNRRG